MKPKPLNEDAAYDRADEALVDALNQMENDGVPTSVAAAAMLELAVDMVWFILGPKKAREAIAIAVREQAANCNPRRRRDDLRRN